MIAPIYVIGVGLFILISFAFYIAVFVLLLRLSSRLQDMNEPMPGRRSSSIPELPNRPKSNLEHKLNRMDDRIRSAEKEQDRARKGAFNKGPQQQQQQGNGFRGPQFPRKPFGDRDQRDTRKNDNNQRQRPQQSGQPQRPAQPPQRIAPPRSEAVPVQVNVNSQAPKPAPVEIKAEPVAAQSAPAPSAPVQTGEIRHGRRTEIKRRYLEEKQNGDTPGTAPVADAAKVENAGVAENTAAAVQPAAASLGETQKAPEAASSAAAIL